MLRGECRDKINRAQNHFPHKAHPVIMVVLNMKSYLFANIHSKNINYYLLPEVSNLLILANKHPLSLPLSYFMIMRHREANISPRVPSKSITESGGEQGLAFFPGQENGVLHKKLK